MKISACLITKNEEKNIERCINSFKDIVQEIIVVDTGSEDETVALAKRLGANVYHFEWNNSFADARNFAIEKARGDWIIFLDADEYFYGDCAKLLPQILEQLKDYEGLLIKFKDFDEDSKKQIQEGTLLRVFKNAPYIRYKGNIHETVFNKRQKMKLANIRDSGVEIHHTGYSLNKIKLKAQRNLELLLKEIENNSSNKMIYYYLSDCYQILGDYEKAIEYAKLFIKTGTVALGYRTKPYHNIIKSMQKLGASSEQLEETIKDFIKKFPNHPDFYRYLGILYLEQKKYSSALQYLLKTIELNEKYNDIEMNTVPSMLDEIYMLVGKIFEMKNDLARALEYYINSLKINKYNSLVFDLVISLIKEEEAEDIIFLLLSIYNKNNKKDVEFLVENLKRLKLGKVLLYFGNIWIKNYGQEDSTIMFMLLSIGNYKEAYRLFKQCYELEKNDWIVDHFILLALLTEDKDELKKIGKGNNKYSRVVNLYINKDQGITLNSLELECYLKLIEQSILLREEKLFNRLVSLRNLITNNVSYRLAHLLMNYRRYNDAINFFNEELGNMGEQSNIYFNIGYCHYKLTNYSKALYYLELAVSVGYNQQDVYEIIEWMKGYGKIS
ncbi:tetratricopeptide repeat-containing glycosyltransferase family 2 protein [Geobacillus thermoleovorans]|uniref:tetratricopeptide repeat-containing glycosyltransferase family 2 protein n=1 Tax=Geobacillus thermoleovorans TaxID=33941 RepID=UPI003DA4E040